MNKKIADSKARVVKKTRIYSAARQFSASSALKASLPNQQPISIRLQGEAIDVQIQMIQREYDMVQSEIAEFSKKSANCRNWTITLWGGSIAFAVTPSQGNAVSFIFISMVFPLMFWLQDIKWTQLQRIFIFRGKSITDYFASDDFVSDFGAGRVTSLNMSGLRKRLDQELFADLEFKKFSSFWRVMFFPTKVTFYPILMLASLIIHVYFNLSEFNWYFHWLFSEISIPP